MPGHCLVPFPNANMNGSIFLASSPIHLSGLNTFGSGKTSGLRCRMEELEETMEFVRRSRQLGRWP